MAVGKLNPLRSPEPPPAEVLPAQSPSSKAAAARTRPPRDAGAARAIVATGDARNPLARGLALPALSTAMKDAQVTPTADARTSPSVGHVVDDPITRALAELEARRMAKKKGGRVTAAPIFATTSGPVSAFLRSVRLNESFDWGLPRHVGPGLTDWTGFKDGATNEVYVVTMAWDLSGREPVVFPPTKIDPATMTRDMHKGDQLTFMGDGLALWPGTQVKGGLYTMVFVMESDSSVRQLGDTIQKVNDAVQKSDLTKALGGLAVAEPDAAALAQALQAISAIAGVVGTVLQQNSDDLVGVFYGTYGVDSLRSRTEHYDDLGASIELRLDAPAPPRAPPPAGGTSPGKKHFD
jgi:hypothetical protein